MSQNGIVLLIVASAVLYVGWNIYRGIVSAAGSCSGGGGGCGGCGCKSTAGGGNLIQLGSDVASPESATSPEEASAVSSERI
ncbi:hypothetical protein [Bremerella cremea]|uniref:hypothetical protein n=1 Tax=Bremerella cremea TaxID=1031537 RepID=UPI0031EB02D3